MVKIVEIVNDNITVKIEDPVRKVSATKDLELTPSQIENLIRERQEAYQTETNEGMLKSI